MLVARPVLPLAARTLPTLDKSHNKSDIIVISSPVRFVDMVLKMLRAA